jgi:hypothetical protein
VEAGVERLRGVEAADYDVLREAGEARIVGGFD